MYIQTAMKSGRMHSDTALIFKSNDAQNQLPQALLGA